MESALQNVLAKLKYIFAIGCERIGPDEELFYVEGTHYIFDLGYNPGHCLLSDLSTVVGLGCAEITLIGTAP
jgi:hypothetical protein